MYPGYGNLHGFAFDISFGRITPAATITAQALNGSTPFTLMGSASISSDYGGLLPLPAPPDDNVANWSPYNGGTVARRQHFGLTTHYSISDHFTGATPSQASIAASITTGANFSRQPGLQRVANSNRLERTILC